MTKLILSQLLRNTNEDANFELNLKQLLSRAEKLENEAIFDRIMLKRYAEECKKA